MANKRVKASKALENGIDLNLSAIYKNDNGGLSGSIEGWSFVGLYGILEELKKLNGLLNCSNFTGFPRTLRTIAKNTTKPRKRKPKVKS